MTIKRLYILQKKEKAHLAENNSEAFLLPLLLLREERMDIQLFNGYSVSFMWIRKLGIWGNFSRQPNEGFRKKTEERKRCFLP